jgi:heme/copper-type cytochrome/quinol oxidase subunit 2
MRAKVVVERPSKFREWVDGLEEPIPTSMLEAISGENEASPEQVGAGGA